MTRLFARAPGKINLCLYLGARRADGLHALVSVMQSVSLADELWLEPAGQGARADEVVCPDVRGPNIATAALAGFREHTNWDGPWQRLTIAKRVPVAAGMGGGSADAAAALRLVAAAAGGRRDAGLEGLAARLGADVPSQLRPGRVLVTGAGEFVRGLSDPPPFGVLVLPSSEALSTASVYVDADRLGLERDAQDLEERLAVVEAELAQPASGARPGGLPLDLLVNDLEPAARESSVAIDEALSVALEVGAERALVSGSGPTVLGIFSGDDGPRRAQQAAARLAGRRPAPIAVVPVGAAFGAPVVAALRHN